MSKYQHQTLHAPQGADLVTDPPSIPETRGRHIEGFFPARHGVLYPSYPLQPCIENPTFPFGPKAVFVYRNYKPLSPALAAIGRTTNDMLVMITGQGQVRWMPLQYARGQEAVKAYWAWAGPVIPSGGTAIDYGGTPPWYTSSFYNGVQIGPELFFCSTHGSSIYSFFVHPTEDVPYLVKLGLFPPPQPLVGLPPVTGGGLTASSYYEYRLTLEDVFGRESSPSPVNAIETTASFTTVDVWLTGVPSQPNRLWTKLHIYRSLAGGGRHYRVHTYDYADAVSGFTFRDNVPDVEAAEAALCPYDNQNDPPRPATHLAVHKNRLWASIEGEYADDQTWYRTPERRSVIQVSNLMSFSQFSRAEATAIDIAGENLAVTDGTELSIDVDTTDSVTGMLSAGAAICVWKRYGMWLVWGDDPTSFSVQFAHNVGCVGPRSVCNFKGQLVWRGPDGIYITNGASGFIPRLISKQISPVFAAEYPTVKASP